MEPWITVRGSATMKRPTHALGAAFLLKAERAADE